MLRLIVHADDFGISEGVNEGIREAHDKGILTSASLMANGAAFDHAVKICSEVPSLDIGIHLTLVEEFPLLAPKTIPTLIGKDGRFHRHATVLARHYVKGKVCLDQVHSELEAQITKVLDQGIRISHLDGHQHAHMLPRILRITTSLAQKYKIPIVRFPSERLHFYMLSKIGALPRVVQLLGLNVLCKLGRHASVRRPDRFAGFYFGGKLNKKNFIKLIHTLPQTGTCEIMCHPGQGDPELKYAHWNYCWTEELDALLDPEVACALQSQAIKLISFRDMSAA